MTTKTPDIGLSKNQKIWRESAGLGIAEFASLSVSLGVVAVADDLIPNLNKAASKQLSKVLIEPYLDNIEHWSQKVCKLKECHPDLSRPREERAEKIAHTLVVFGEAWVLSMLAKMGVRKWTNKKFNVDSGEEPRNGKWFHDKVLYRKQNKHDWNVLLWDEGVHLGSFILGNFVMAKHTDKVIDGLSGTLEKTLGWTKQKAHNVASMFMIWEVPNIIGFGAGVTKIFQFHNKGNAPAQKIINAALSDNTGHTPPAPGV